MASQLADRARQDMMAQLANWLRDQLLLSGCRVGFGPTPVGAPEFHCVLDGVMFWVALDDRGVWVTASSDVVACFDYADPDLVRSIMVWVRGLAGRNGMGGSPRCRSSSPTSWRDI